MCLRRFARRTPRRPVRAAAGARKNARVSREGEVPRESQPRGPSRPSRPDRPPRLRPAPSSSPSCRDQVDIFDRAWTCAPAADATCGPRFSSLIPRRAHTDARASRGKPRPRRPRCGARSPSSAGLVHLGGEPPGDDTRPRRSCDQPRRRREGPVTDRRLADPGEGVRGAVGAGDHRPRQRATFYAHFDNKEDLLMTGLEGFAPPSRSSNGRRTRGVDRPRSDCSLSAASCSRTPTGIAMSSARWWAGLSACCSGYCTG